MLHRIEAFNVIFGQHMRVNRLDLISVDDVERIINGIATTPYLRTQIVSLLEVNTDMSNSCHGINKKKLRICSFFEVC